MEFVPLHIHSDYTLLRSTVTIKGLIERSEELGIKTLALTDTMSLSGAYEFYNLCKKKNIKAIIGLHCLILCDDEEGRNYFVDMILLAKNHQGYLNLCNICDRGSKRGYNLNLEQDSFVTFEDILPFCKDLVAISCFEKGELSQWLVNKDMKKFKQVLATYQSTFEDFYVEIENHPTQRELAKLLIDVSQRYNFKIVVTNSVYYLNQDDAKVHHLHTCIGEKSLASDGDDIRFGSATHYLRSAEEMQGLFPSYPQFLQHTIDIAQLCDFHFWKDKNHYPVFKDVEEGVTQEAFLRKLCYSLLDYRYPNIEGEELTKVKDRIDFELATIDKSGYASYFLVVWDFIQYAYREGIPVGPGRGSGAGSVVAYLLEITDLDPIRYNLLFERFLNPERISPPDFDIDFCENRRIEVIAYVVKKYGEDKVVQIGTFGKLKQKAVVKDVNRVLGNKVKFGEVLSNMIIEKLGVKDWSLKDSLENSNELRIEYETDSEAKKVIDYAIKLEGLTRQLGIHAAGVIISDAPITNYTAVFRGKKGEIITQFDGATCEKLGLLKMDFLGLRTLTVIQEAINLIEVNYGRKINFRKMTADDAPTYEIFQEGRTIGIFQFESLGMRKHLKNLQPTVLEDLIAMNALYRPGPMAYIDDFIKNKKDAKNVKYDLPEMEEYLAETYGITVYQEQVMLLSQKLADFSKGEADSLRKAMGKKLKNELDKMFPKFLKNAMKKGHAKEILEKIWADWESFTKYAFNKSHSTAYAWIAYQTAYLKRYYPLDFFVAYLNSMKDISSMAAIFDDCLESGVKILQPDVNNSQVHFTTEKNCVRFGLASIKGSGEGVAKAIVLERETNGKFLIFADFCQRLGSQLGINCIQNMIIAGAMDCLNEKRAALFEVCEVMVDRSKEDKRQEELGQGSLFDSFADDIDKEISIAIPQVDEWSNEVFFTKEKNILGSYISGHPIIAKKKCVQKLINNSLADINNIQKEALKDSKRALHQDFTILARVRDVHVGKTREGMIWSKVILEDESGFCDFSFRERFNVYEDTLLIGSDIFIIGGLRKFQNFVTKKIYEIFPVKESYFINYDEVQFRFKDNNEVKKKLADIINICQQYSNNCPAIIHKNLLAFLIDRFFSLTRQKKSDIEVIEQMKSNLMAQVVEYCDWQLIKQLFENFKVEEFTDDTDLIAKVKYILEQAKKQLIARVSRVVFRLETKQQLIFYKTSLRLFLSQNFRDDLMKVIKSKEVFYRLKEDENDL